MDHTDFRCKTLRVSVSVSLEFPLYIICIVMKYVYTETVGETFEYDIIHSDEAHVAVRGKWSYYKCVLCKWAQMNSGLFLSFLF